MEYPRNRLISFAFRGSKPSLAPFLGIGQRSIIEGFLCFFFSLVSLTVYVEAHNKATLTGKVIIPAMI